VVKFQSYSTGDITLSTETVFVIEAEVDCKGAEVREKEMHPLLALQTLLKDSLSCCHGNVSSLQSLSLYALVGDQLMPVARSIGSNQYQVCMISATADKSSH